ncbi:MAG: glycoside hydrolase family 95 protein [Eubacteriales bacterium]
MRLWYQQESKKWTDALPIGNGRMGAMVYGKVAQEKVCLNEDTLWSGYPQNTQIKDAAKTYKVMQNLMKEHKYGEVAVEIEDHFLGKFSESYLPFGDLELEFLNLKDAEITEYTRELCLDTAITSVNFVGNGVKYKREYFVSKPDNAVIISITANQKESIDLAMSFTCQMPHQVVAQGSTLVMTGLAPSHVVPDYMEEEPNPIRYEEDDCKKGMRFCGLAEMEAVDGNISSLHDKIQVLGATQVTIKIFMQTSFNGYDKLPYVDGKDCLALVKADSSNIGGKPYEVMKKEHIADYQKYYNRVTLSFCDIEEDKPTDARLEEFKTTRDSKHLYELLFHYGRYLTIASSREGTQPGNLQGIWNKDLRPTWSCNFTININAQMNYWGTEIVNLSELHTPLLQFIEILGETGKETAKTQYNARGSVAHHNSDIWGLSTPVGETGWRGQGGVLFWNMSYGWLTRHLFEHYEYTLDQVFLKEKAYPAMKAAAEYYLDILVKNEDQYLWITPTASPENKFMYEGKPYNIANHATMTIAIVREVFDNVIKCCDILELDEAFKHTVEEAKGKLYPYQIGSKGQLLEWDLEYEEEDMQHRHISHLYPLYPSNQITEETTPDLFEACKKTLEFRGDSGTGWSLAWKINFWARLKNGNRALELVKNQLHFVETDEVNYSDGGGTYLNMFDAHPPFQIDGNLGAYAGICEMLVQSYEHTILLLPALPDELPDGEVTGLRVKNGLEIDFSFAKGRLETVSLQSKVEEIVGIQIEYKGNSVSHKFLPYETLVLRYADFM